MNCRSALRELEPFADGELPEPRRAQVRDHLAGCPACAEELRVIRLLDVGAAAVEAPPVGERQWGETWEGIRNGIHHGPLRLPRSGYRNWPPLVAAAVILASLAGLVLYLRGPSRDSGTLPGASSPVASQPALVPGLSEVLLIESPSPDYVPTTIVADDGSTIVWIAEVTPGT